MAILARFPPNLIFTIGILRPIKWLRKAKRSRLRNEKRSVRIRRRDERNG
jgi:hypothetical protein